MKSWIEFHDKYLPSLPGCSYFAGANALRMAAQEFCERTKAWRVALDGVTTLAATPIYDFPLSQDQDLFELVNATLDGQPLDLLLDDEANGHSHGILVLNPLQFQLYPTPAAGAVVQLKAVLRPSELSAGVEDFLFQSYGETIAHGAKARLMADNSAPYADAAGSARSQAIFDNAIGRVTLQVAKSFSRAPLRVKARFL